MAKKKKQNNPNIITVNKKARFDYSITEDYQAGIELQGWEVKSLRQGKIQINESYILLKHNQAYLFGALITPLITASTHTVQDPLRLRKLLMNRKELDRLAKLVDQKGFTLVPLNLHWSRGKVKLSVGLAKGKKLHDNRATAKERDWNRDNQRLFKMTR